MEIVNNMRNIVKKYPIIFSIAFVILTIVIPWGSLYIPLKSLPYYYGFVIKYAITLFLSIGITMAIYKKIPFSLKNKNYFKGLFTFGLLGLICAFIAFVCSMSGFDRQTNFNEVFSFILYILFVALSEEYLFRVLILGILLDKYGNDKKSALICVLISSIIFGLRHYINLITMPNTIISTTGQVLFTFMAGFYLACVYIRTKNIYIGLTIHFLEDIFTMCWLLFSIEAFNNQNVDGSLLNISLLVLVHTIYVLSGIFMINDKRYNYEGIRL